MFLRNGRWSYAVVNAIDRDTGLYIQARRNYLKVSNSKLRLSNINVYIHRTSKEIFAYKGSY